jgi:predicted transposase YbfD/YdcC
VAGGLVRKAWLSSRTGPPEKRAESASRKALADAKELRDLIRAHWQIENNCHCQLNTTFREDANKTRAGNAAKYLGTDRRIVLNLLNQDHSTIKSLPRKRSQAMLNYM